MVNGQMKCLGSSQHLKQRFGNGYEVNIKLRAIDITTNIEAIEMIRLIFDSNIISNLFNINKDINNEELIELIINNNITINKSDIQQLCQSLEHIERLNTITSTGSGMIIYDSLQMDDTVTLKLFIEWWVNENQILLFNNFMLLFGINNYELLERSSMYTFKYRILRYNTNITSTSTSTITRNDKITLTNIFEKFESNKIGLKIQEYSVSDTSLENIFNNFAATQDNPEVQAQQHFINSDVNSNNSVSLTDDLSASQVEVIMCH